MHAQNTAAASVAILAVAAYCQIWSATLSAVPAPSGASSSSAILYVVASAVAVVLGSALMALIGISGAAISASSRARP